MKKNVLALSIAAMIGGLGFAGVASAAVIAGTGPYAPAAAPATMATATATALTMAEGGVGHALVVPYYNAQNGNMSVLHVTNTDQTNGKLVKIRFRSAANSDDVLDFQIFMSPGDVWTGAVTAGANGVAQITTADNTCTVPALTSGVAQPFVQDRLPGYLSADAKANLTREGYVEIFNMADIDGSKLWDVNGVPNAAGPNRSPLYTAVKHNAGVAPCSMAGSAARTLVNNTAIADMTEAQAAVAGLNTPTGGLMGDWYIINVAQTTTFAGAATAIRATVGAGGADGRANYVHFPQLGTAAVPAANAVTADPLFRTANIFDANGTALTTAALPLLNFDLPDMSTPYILAATPLTQAAALTTQLAVKSITNQYANDASISAKTDWVFSMPSRRYNVAANYAAVTGTGATGATSSNPAYRRFTDLDATTPAADQVSNWFYPAAAAAAPNMVATAGYLANGNTTVDANGNICVIADGQKFYDREETTGGAAPVFSPGLGSSVQFCGEVSVLAFQDTGNSVLAASVARRTITSGTYQNGWGVLTTTNVGLGLPILGASFIKLSNPQAAPGVSGTYGITWPHRFTK